jgi:3-polyprenyl-4-hydroxybenzoate decarboxylase
VSERWIRSQRAAVVEVGDRVLLVGGDGGVRALEGDSGELARAVIGMLAAARTRDEVVERVEALAGPLGPRAAVVDELLALLRSTGAVVEARDVAGGRGGLNIVAGISGALAATHAPALVRALQQRGHTVEVALTPTARRFVSIDALAAITQRAVHVEMWPAAPHAPVPHIALAEWADVVLVYPASATTIARLAGGDYSELVAAVAGCTRAPVVIVPSMNAAMLESPAVARNLDVLRGDGRIVIAGVPSAEAADAPSLREAGALAAPSPGEVVATLEALRGAGIVKASAQLATSGSDWDRIYRAARLPWASEHCDADLADAIARFAPRPVSVLDVGTGLGQVARHAAAAGHRVVATDISEVALALASRVPGGESIVWLRDDIGATALATAFDVVIDRATLHTLSDVRAAAWSAVMPRLVRPGGHLIVKAHQAVAAGVAERLPDFELVHEAVGELPGVVSAEPVPSTLVVLRRKTR